MDVVFNIYTRTVYIGHSIFCLMQREKLILLLSFIETVSILLKIIAQYRNRF